MPFFHMLAQCAVLAAACSTDSLISGFAYGAGKVRTPFASIITIGGVCSLILAFAVFLGSVAGQGIPSAICKAVSAGILFALGVAKVFEPCVKVLVNKFKKKSIILTIYTTPEAADCDQSKSLTVYESIFLAFALSLDNLAIGFGAGLVVNQISFYLLLCALCFVGCSVFLLLGKALGAALAQRLTINLSNLGGLLLILLALIRFFSY